MVAGSHIKFFVLSMLMKTVGTVNGKPVRRKGCGPMYKPNYISTLQAKSFGLSLIIPMVLLYGVGGVCAA